MSYLEHARENLSNSDYLPYVESATSKGFLFYKNSSFFSKSSESTLRFVEGAGQTETGYFVNIAISCVEYFQFYYQKQHLLVDTPHKALR